VRSVYIEMDAFTLFALPVGLGEQVEWVLVFIQLRQWEMCEGGATVRRDEEEEECSALDWIGSTYELVIYVHSINSKEGPWLSIYISIYNDVPELPPTYVCSDIVTKRDIALYIEAGGNTCIGKLCLLVLGRYVCCCCCYGD